jgi:hypothetical protein
MGLQLLGNKALSWSIMALHKKSGQKTDPQVNKDFLASFWLSFKTRKPHFGRKKHHYGTLFVQSRVSSGNPHPYWLQSRYGKVTHITAWFVSDYHHWL